MWRSKDSSISIDLTARNDRFFIDVPFSSISHLSQGESREMAERCLREWLDTVDPNRAQPEPEEEPVPLGAQLDALLEDHSVTDLLDALLDLHCDVGEPEADEITMVLTHAVGELKSRARARQVVVDPADA